MLNQRRVVLFLASTLIAILALSRVQPNKKRLSDLSAQFQLAPTLTAELGGTKVYWDTTGAVDTQLAEAERVCPGLTDKLKNSGPECKKEKGGSGRSDGLSSKDPKDLMHRDRRARWPPSAH